MTYPSPRWMSLDLGYVSLVPDTHAPKPPQQNLFENLIPCPFRVRWSRGNTTPLAINPDLRNEDWVAAVLEKEINAALVAANVTDRVRVAPGDYCDPRPNDTRVRQLHASLHQASVTGRPGTKCQLRGDVWINSREYLVTAPTGLEWRPNGLGAAYFVVATLVWQCHDVSVLPCPAGTMPAIVT